MLIDVQELARLEPDTLNAFEAAHASIYVAPVLSVSRVIRLPSAFSHLLPEIHEEYDAAEEQNRSLAMKPITKACQLVLHNGADRASSVGTDR